MTLDELDRLAAELIMGFHYTKAQIAAGELTPFHCWNDTHYSPKTWYPTRNIEQAWTCLEKLNQPFNIWTTETNNNYWAGFFPCQHNGIVIAIEATSAPEAIVRACLRAKGVKV